MNEQTIWLPLTDVPTPLIIITVPVYIPNTQCKFNLRVNLSVQSESVNMHTVHGTRLINHLCKFNFSPVR